MKASLTKLSLTAVTALSLSACAKSTSEIAPQYVSPMQYQSSSCQQIEAELSTLTQRITSLGGQVDKTASNDAAQMGIGLVLFWPALFFLDGDTPQAAEYARLRGEFDALEKAGIKKDCGIEVERPVEVKPQTTAPRLRKRH